MKLKEFLNGGRAFLDGAMGTELIKRGYKHRTELLNVENPSVLTEIHLSYVNAGSDIVCANTFNCNAKKADLSKYSLKELVFGAVNAARAAKPKYVLYDCGPIGELLYPSGRLSFDECYELFKEQALYAAESGCDGAIIETMSDLQEMRCAILAFKENTDLTLMCSMSFEENGRTFLGVDPACFVLTAQALGADTVGVNCGLGPDKALQIVERMALYSQVPVFAKPNAGLPNFINGNTLYDMNAVDFSEYCAELAKIGASHLGGCCGTDAEYIRLTKNAVSGIPIPNKGSLFDGICSYARLAEFSEKTLKIGERINPTNKPLLKQALKDRDFDYILSQCLTQRDEGADILDINVGMAGIDERQILKETVCETQGIVGLPLCIDTAKKDALNDALRIYNGVALINSVSGEDAVCDRVFPLAVKYGAYVIALLLDENGIPPTAEGRLAVADKIAAKAKEYGILPERLLFDPLTMAVSVNYRNGKILLDIIDGLRARNFKTVLGLSNISFGLPARSKLNGALFSLVKERKVTAAIINPKTEENRDDVSIALLSGNDPDCAEYIKENAALPPETEKTSELTIKQCVEKGLTKDGMAVLKSRLTNENADKIMEEEIIGGLNSLGEKYAANIVFLPGLIAGSETAKAMLDHIKSVCFSSGGTSKATVIIATVKGDVHDIGKNIVKTVAANYGYRMIDLGRDVPTEKITAAIEEYKPQAVALSALMTTTLDNMTETVKEIKIKYPDIKIMVGGAVVTEEYAHSVGAIYSKDAREACLVLEKLFG